jgi:hypothetical protein
MPNQLILPDDYGLFTVRFTRSGYSGHEQTVHIGGRIGTSPDIGDMLDTFVAAWTDTGSFNDAQPTSITAQNLNLRIRLGGDLFSFDRVNPWAAGGGNPTLLSPAVSYTQKTHTLFAGRRFRGRFQLPWAVESEVSTGGVIDSSVVTAYGLAGEVFRLAFNADATKLRGPYLLHTINGLDPTIINAITCRDTVGTVRRRQVVGH